MEKRETDIKGQLTTFATRIMGHYQDRDPGLLSPAWVLPPNHPRSKAEVNFNPSAKTKKRK